MAVAGRWDRFCCGRPAPLGNLLVVNPGAGAIVLRAAATCAEIPEKIRKVAANVSSDDICQSLSLGKAEVDLSTLEA